MTRLGIILCMLMALAVPVLSATEPVPFQAGSLRATFAGRFPVGVALDGFLPGDYTADEQALIRRQFATVTPANCMKMTHLQPEEGQFDWKMADALVAYATANDLKVCGHCLVWAKDERTPAWIFQDGDQAAGRELLLARMQTHIQTVAGRYRGQVVSWDVVNEALDDGEPIYRPSKWLSVLGEAFIDQAFRFAHQADPGALLVYNDYNLWMPAKREKAMTLLRGLVERKVPIHAVGMQGHWELDAVPFQDVEETIVAIHHLGLKVMVTELDLDAVPRSRWWADGNQYREEMAKTDPLKDGCPPELLQRQAEQYARLFAIFTQHSNTIARITFWDLHDGRSWLNHFPWERTNHPLLFDRYAQPKPAFRAVLEAAWPSAPADSAATQQPRKIRILLVGDSTVHDQGGWGAGFKRLIDGQIECVNAAQKGRSSKSFIEEGHWKKALACAPDFVLIQFGHNDMPGKGPQRETDPDTTYRDWLSRYVDESRAMGAVPVLITPMTRRTFRDGQVVTTLGDYARAVREVARAQQAPLIDLHSRSIELINRLGPAESETLGPIVNGQPDRTHLSPKGQGLMAALVAGELRQVIPQLALHLKTAVTPSPPTHAPDEKESQP